MYVQNILRGPSRAYGRCRVQTAPLAFLIYTLLPVGGAGCQDSAMRIKRIVAFLALLACSCQEKEPAVVPVTQVRVTPSELDMFIGESKALEATVSPSDATSPSVSWASSKPSVVSVSNDGRVSALSEGTATITATAGGKKGTCTVNVSRPFVEVKSITLNKSTLSLVEEQSETLIATVKPDDATEPSVTWTSSNKSVADIGRDGTVLAVRAGYATITASAGAKSASCGVEVVPKHVDLQTITLSATELTLNKGEKRTLTATVKPDNATDKTVRWTSSDNAVATIQQDGTITAMEEGTAVIIAVSNNKTATCKVTVIIPVESVMLNQSAVSVNKGESFTLSATVSPDNATDKSVKWESSDKNIVSVENGFVRALGAGTATITARAGNKSAQCQVTVSVPLEFIVLSRTKLSMYIGQQTSLPYDIYPSDATGFSIVWVSSDAAIVKVNNGQLTACSEGTAVITVKSGTISATCTVQVDRIGNGGHEGIGYENWN